MKRALRIASSTLLGILLLVLAVPGTSGPDDSKWRPDDILLAESAGQMDISPDGHWAVWVGSPLDKKKDGRISNLILSSLTGGDEIQLTRGKANHSSPKWSPDGTRIAFLSSRPVPDKKPDVSQTQLWLINPAGGEPWHLTKFERGIRGFAWISNDSIAFIAQEDPTNYERDVKKLKDTSRVIEDAAHEPPVRLFRFEIKSKKTERISSNDDWMARLAISPDGRWAVTYHRRSLSFAFDHKVTPVLFLTNLETDETTAIDPGERMPPGAVDWAKDSSGFYYTTEYSSHPLYFTASISLLRYFDLATGESAAVDLDWANGLGNRGGTIQATADGFLALLADGVRYRPARYTKQGDGWKKTDLTGDHASNLFGWALGGDGGTLVYNHSTASKPTQWYNARLNGTSIDHAAQLTKLNPSFEKKPIHKTEVIHWKGANGDVVDGILYYPLGYQEGNRYPLSLMIHGGPAGNDMDSWVQSWTRMTTLLTQRGAFVLKVNYHGSGNYGLEWVESIGEGKYYDLEHIDLMGGVNHLIGLGLVDEDRLGSIGWSNGAILTTDLITRYPGKFKVASAGAGDVEWISDWGNVMFGASFDNYYFGKAPYEDPELYVRKSPYFRLKDVTTPTILHTGTEDVNVPPSQSWSHYRVMQQATNIPVKFITYPGEPHSLRKYVHQKRKLESDMEWFDRYLFNTYEEPNEALREGSPLDTALKSAVVMKDRGRYGVIIKKKLVPEVVSFGEAAAGRFEVTRAQYAAFDKNYKVEPGTDNLPANGITFERAQAYIAWLSKHTGIAFRLPNGDEVDALYGKDDGGGNTLDRWAGYSPNPDDVALLHKKAAELGGTAPLLTEVGRFKGQGDENHLFDLGGNVAEWTVGADGTGKLAGGSADQAANGKTTDNQAGEAYRGFRVVRE